MAQQNPPPPAPLPMSPALPPQPPAPDDAPPRRGCAWLALGAVGCLLLIAAPVAGLLLAGTVTINGLLAGAQSVFNPQTVVTIQTMVESIQGLSQLTTVRHSYSAVVTSERDMPDALKLLYGEKQVMVAAGHVNAGVDLSQLAPDDIARDGDTIIVSLPAPQLQDCFVNEAQSYIASLETGLFARSAPELVVEGRRFAVRHFRERALNEDRILETAQTQAQAVVAGLVTALAPGARVTVLTAPLPDPAPLPPTCQ